MVHPSSTPSTPEYPRVYPRVECRVRVQAWADALAGAVRLTAEWAEAVVGASSDGSPRTPALRALSVDSPTHRDTHTQALRALSVDPQTHRDTRTHARTHRYAHRDTPACEHTLMLARTRTHVHARTHAGQPDAIAHARIETGPKRSFGDGSAVGLRVQRVRVPGRTSGCVSHRPPHAGADAPGAHGSADHNGDDAAAVRRLQPEWDSCEVRRRRRAEVAAAPAPSVLPYP